MERQKLSACFLVVWRENQLVGHKFIHSFIYSLILMELILKLLENKMNSTSTSAAAAYNESLVVIKNNGSF